MAKTIRAKITRGLIRPLEELDLPEGTEVSVAILERPAKSGKDAFVRSAGKWKGKVNSKRLIKSIYASRLLSTRKPVEL